MSTDLAVRDGATLFAGATPQAVIEAATEAATELHSVIEQRNLYQRIGGREHVLVEGWQTCGVITGVFAVKDGGVEPIPWPLIPNDGLPGPTDPGREPWRSSTEWPAWKRRRGPRRRVGRAAVLDPRPRPRPQLRVPRRLQGGQGRPRGRWWMRRQMHLLREELGDPRRLRAVLDGADPRAVKDLAAAPGVHRQPGRLRATTPAEEPVTAARLTSPRRRPTPPPSSTRTRSRRSPRNCSACGPASTGTGSCASSPTGSPDGIPRGRKASR